jgi:hypothetical protein
MSRIPRTPRVHPASPASIKSADKKAALPDIPVTFGTLFLGFIALSTIAQFACNGLSFIKSSRALAASEACLPFITLATAGSAANPPVFDDTELATRRAINERNGYRNTMIESMDVCPPDSCEGRELKKYQEAVYQYWPRRMDALMSSAKEFGQAGVDRELDSVNTFEDHDIENHMKQMVLAGKLPMSGGGNSHFERATVALGIFMKHGANALVPCGSKQAEAVKPKS